MTLQKTDAPDLRGGGLVTVAFLKAQLDGGSDHLGIFMPLVLDVVARMETQTFATVDVQRSLGTSHGVAMPQETVSTLLKRAVRKGYLLRESGRYRRSPAHPLPTVSVAAEKAQIEESQRHLAEALFAHAQRRDLR